MARKINWTDEARADLRAIDPETALGVPKNLARYALTGAGDIKQAG